MICSECRNEITPDSFFCPRCSAFTPMPTAGQKANLFARWVAWVIDPLVAFAAWGLAIMLGGVLGALTGSENAIAGLTVLMAVLFPVCYFIWFLTLLPKGLTPGKKLLGLQVVNHQTGSVPGFGTMFLREIVGRILSGLFLGLGYFWALWDKNAQAWHDKLAGTVVVKRSVHSVQT